MRNHHKLTDEERRQIIEARADGTPVKALARQYGVSRRTIYNTLNKAQRARQGHTQTISLRVSRRELAGFKDGMAKRSITDHPAALRRLMEAADVLLRPADPVVLDHLQAWGVQVATQGAAVNNIARKLNAAKLRGSPIPFTDEDMTTIRAFAGGFVEFAEEFRILWEAQRAAKTREVDKVLAGLTTKRPDH
ncbi:MULTISPECIES: helix-turn-helix domain-containing protein [unclassified Yoonia]|uniref:helix-turn-helix domain-containing protein n=1 Tax=unclassified Yoonia TaxID=2629118 RepID=UPI002AFF53EE|nr:MULTISPECIES: helix-turn-helix domain-containing protein [unclassified Yoonia]